MQEYKNQYKVGDLILYSDEPIDDGPDEDEVAQDLNLLQIAPKKKKAYRPTAISKQMFALIAIIVLANGLCVLAIATQLVQWQAIIIAFGIDMLLIPAFERIKTTVDNHELIIFSGTIIDVEQCGIKHLNYYNIVTVQDEAGVVLRFKCQDNNHIMPGKPITFFVNKNSKVTETEQGVLIPYITVQYSAYKGKSPEDVEEPDNNQEIQRAKTIEEYINKI